MGGVFKRVERLKKTDEPKKNDNERRDDETAQEYQARVAPNLQPLAQQPTTNYLGEPRL